MAKLDEIKAGDVLIAATDVMGCIEAGEHPVLENEFGHRFIVCGEGRHYIADMADDAGEIPELSLKVTT